MATSPRPSRSTAGSACSWSATSSTTRCSFADAHLSIFWRSCGWPASPPSLTLIFGFPTAYFIATRPERQRDIWLFLITIPFWTNLLIRTFAMLEMIRNEGIINTSLHLMLGIIDQPIQMLFTDFAISFGMVYVYLPLMVLPLYASMEKLDFRLVEAGYDLYAARLAVLRRIIIPLVKPGIIAGSILVFIPALGAYVTPRVLGGGKNMMLGNLIELQFGQGRNWPLGAALSITLMVIVMVALLVYVRNAVANLGAGALTWRPRSARSSINRSRASASWRSPCSSCSICRSSCWSSSPSTTGIGRRLGRLLAALVRGGLEQPGHQGRGLPLAVAGGVRGDHRHVGGDDGGARDHAHSALPRPHLSTPSSTSR